MRESYSPSEQLEANDKREKREKGRKEALFWHALLQTLGNRIGRLLNESGVAFNSENIKLKDIKGLSSIGELTEIFKSSVEAVTDGTINGEKITPPSNVYADLEPWLEMSPKEITKYLNDTSDSLIKP